MNFKSTHSFLSERNYRKILTEIGFTIDQIEQKKQEHVFAGREQLMPFLKAILTPIYHLPERKRQDFLSDYYEQLDSLGDVGEKGEVTIHFDKIELALSK